MLNLLARHQTASDGLGLAFHNYPRSVLSDAVDNAAIQSNDLERFDSVWPVLSSPLSASTRACILSSRILTLSPRLRCQHDTTVSRHSTNLGHLLPGLHVCEGLHDAQSAKHKRPRRPKVHSITILTKIHYQHFVTTQR